MREGGAADKLLVCRGLWRVSTGDGGVGRKGQLQCGTVGGAQQERKQQSPKGRQGRRWYYVLCCLCVVVFVWRLAGLAAATCLLLCNGTLHLAF